MGFNQYNLGQHLPCQVSCIWGKWFWRRFQFISVYFFGSKPGHPGEDLFWTLEPLYEQTRLSTTRQFYIPNFKQLSLEKKIFKYILLANPGSPGIEPFWTNLVKDHATYQIPSISAMRLWRRRFLNAFLCISRLQTQAPLGGAIFDPGTFIRTNLVKDF